jgi:hypothetical protein
VLVGVAHAGALRRREPLREARRVADVVAEDDDVLVRDRLPGVAGGLGAVERGLVVGRGACGARAGGIGARAAAGWSR